MVTFKKTDNLSMEERLERFNQRMEEVKKTRQIELLKSQLTSTDYQIIKCYEYSLAGLELPYDIQTLHTEREAIREQIRELENTN
jgi:hypothetical protein